MKAKKLLILPLAAALAAATISSATAAFAATGDGADATFYPQDFERQLTFDEGLCDYAVDGDNVAFASNTSIFILSAKQSGERELLSFLHGSEITRLDYSEHKLYFEALTKTYLYSGGKASEATDYTIPEKSGTKVTLTGGNEYRLASDGLHFFGADGSHVELGTEYSNVKAYDDVAYAVKADCVYRFDGAEAVKLDLGYTDFSGADNICVGDAKDALKSGDYKVKTAIVRGGVYSTQIDPDQINEKFVQIETKKTEGEKPCIVLCESGNAAVYATDDGCFITASENLESREYSSPNNDWKTNSQGKKTAYATIDVGVYSSPYMCEGTKIDTLASGSSHPVTVTEKFALDFIERTFYRVSYEKDGKTVSGFVAANFLTEYDFALEDKEPVDGGDQAFVYDTNVTTVVLVIVIIALVMIAVMYVSVVSAKRNKKNKQPKEDKPAPPPAQEE